MRPVSWLLPLFLFTRAAGAGDPLPVIEVERIATPARPGASGASLTTAPDDTVWLTWLEPAAAGSRETALRFSTFDAAAKRWRPAGTIAHGTNWLVNWADFPTLASGDHGVAIAAWSVRNPPSPHGATAAATNHDEPGYHAIISRTNDGGRTWTPGTPLTTESDSVEFVSLAMLEDGRTLAAWLDGRGRKAGKPPQLYARVLGSGGPDMLVDASVCDCCQTALTAFPDGTALLAYRGRGENEVRDIRITRFRGDRWDEPRTLNHDDWRIAGCPVNGPQLASDGGRVAVAWFTAPGDNPQVLASYSSDAGTRFLMPLRLDVAKPVGRVDTLLLRDGAMLVTWLSADAQFWLRRINPEYTADDAVLLGRTATGFAGGFPRTALLRDYRGGKTTAQFLAVFTTGDAPTGIDTVLATVPEGELLTVNQNCDCAPTPEQLQGFSMRGTFIEAKIDMGTIRVRHYELPGIFAAGTRDFKVTPDVARIFQPDRQFFGRIEKRDGAWWLYDIRFIAAPKP